MAATSNTSDALLEQENAAILCVLTEADEYYKEQQRLGKTIRKGFLDLAKARQAVGPSSSISALNVREELSAQFSVDADDAFVRDRRVLPVLPRPAARARSGLARLGWAGRAGAAGVFDYFLDVTVGCRQSV